MDNYADSTSVGAPSTIPHAEPSLTEKAKEKTGHMVDQAKDQVKSQLSAQKDRAASSLEGVAEALHETSRSLDEKGQGAVGQYADTAASQVERLTGYLREKDVEDMMAEVDRFARSRTGLFIGGAFFIGLAAGRFLKSSGQNSDGDRARYYGTESLHRAGNRLSDPASVNPPPHRAHNYVPGVGVTEQRGTGGTALAAPDNG